MKMSRRGHPAQSGRQLAVFSVRDGKAFEGVLEKIKTALMGATAAQLFQSREFMGTTIHAMASDRPPNAPPTGSATPVVSYAVTAHYFVLGVGGEDLVETAIQGIESPLPSFWSRPDMKSAIATLPDGAVGYGYTDMSKLVAANLEQFTQWIQMARWRVKDGKFYFQAPPALEKGKGNRHVDEAAKSKSPGDSGKPPVESVEKPPADVIARYWGPLVSASYHDATGFYSIMRLENPK